MYPSDAIQRTTLISLNNAISLPLWEGSTGKTTGPTVFPATAFAR